MQKENTPYFSTLLALSKNHSEELNISTILLNMRPEVKTLMNVILNVLLNDVASRSNSMYRGQRIRNALIILINIVDIKKDARIMALRISQLIKGNCYTTSSFKKILQKKNIV
jgi:hypothetical protein